MSVNCCKYFPLMIALFPGVGSAWAQGATAETPAAVAATAEPVITQPVAIEAPTSLMKVEPTLALTSERIVNVAYTVNFPDGSWLKERPTEVRIVRAKNTQNNVAAQIGLNVLMLAMGVGAGFRTFSKDGLKGEEITDLIDRSNIKNPIPTDFAMKIDQTVNAWIQTKPEYKTKTFKHTVNVAGGSSRLMYEALSGEDAEKYKLATEMVIYKQRESVGFFSFRPSNTLDCGEKSKLTLTEKEWAEDNYSRVKTQLALSLESCEAKLVGQLDEFLKD